MPKTLTAKEMQTHVDLVCENLTNGEQIAITDLADALGWRYEVGNMVKREMIRRGQITQQRRKDAPNLLTYHAPALALHRRTEYPPRYGREKHYPQARYPLPPIVIAQREMEIKQAAAMEADDDAQAYQGALLPPATADGPPVWEKVLTPTFDVKAGSYTAEQLRPLAESVLAALPDA